ncbi:TetR/AcrR family transcriptional regulator C-terminal domain-containing protein [Streptomyces sp. NPDC048417]|uniref:TetR/AcrR family transcriptional regulator C-terminal domain-containing protein n=1 Tax=Streptomyces sp. NPDC048417 TaxID=3155387 RepID=UPI0034251ADC
MAGPVEPARREPIWLRPERPEKPQRGPQPAYTRSEIVAAAVAIADREGVEAMTMRKVATAIGAGTMSVYRYVPSKQDLYDLMVDTVWSELAIPDTPGDWRPELSTLAAELRVAAHRHPWAVSVGLSGWGFGPGFLRCFEFALSALDGLGMPVSRMVEAVQLLVIFVEAFVTNELRDAELARETGMSEQQRWMARIPYVQQVVASGRYPMFARLLTEGDHVNAELQFTRGVDRVLDGIEAGIAQETSPPGPGR